MARVGVQEDYILLVLHTWYQISKQNKLSKGSNTDQKLNKLH